MSLTMTELCPKCNAPMQTHIDPQECVTKTFCHRCGYEAKVLNYITYTDSSPRMAVGKFPNPYRNVIIEAETLQIHHNNLGLTIDIPINSLRNIETIEINGFKYKKEN